MAGRGSSLDIQKKQAQRQRAEQAHQLQKEKLQNSIPMPSSALFDKPVRKSETTDPTVDFIQRVLGNHEHIKDQMTKDMRSFIGISSQPQTPLVDPKDSKKFAFTKPDKEETGKRKLFDKEEKPRKKEIDKSGSHNDESKQSNRGDKANYHLSKHAERDRDKSHDRERKTSPVSSNKSRHSMPNSVKHPPSQSSASDPYSRYGSKPQRKSSSSHSPSPSPVKKPPATVSSSLSSSTTSSSSSNKVPHTPKKDEAKNKHQYETDSSKTKEKSQMINGAVVINGAALKPKHQPNLPKLDIREAQKNAEPDVDVILKEMTRLHQPLTAIHTPHKDEAKFPFPLPVNSENTASQNLKKAFASLDREKDSVKVTSITQVRNQGKSLSDESDTEDMLPDDHVPRGQAKAPITTSSGGGGNAPVKEPRSPMSSDSEASSEESDTDSDVSGNSDSPSSDEDEDDGEGGDPEVPKQASPPRSKQESKNSSSDSNWSLSRFITNNESPISALSTSGGSKVSDKKNDSKSPQKDENDELISNLIRNIGSDSEENHDSSGCMDIDNFHPVIEPLCSPPSSASNRHSATSSKSASESPRLSSSKSKNLNCRSPVKENSSTPFTNSYSSPAKQHHSGSKSSSSNSKRRNSERTPSKEMKVVTSTPEASVHTETVHNQSAPTVSDSCDSDSEEIDVESVTPGKEAIPNTLRQNALEHSDVTRCLEFNRQNSEESRHSNSSSVKSERKHSSSSKSKDSKTKDQNKTPGRKKSKENKENKKKNISIDKDIKNIFDEVINKEILSPIPPEKSFPRVPEKSKPKPASIPGLSFKDDKPSIIVRLDLSLFKPYKQDSISDISSKSVSENLHCEHESVSENLGECDMDIDMDLKDSRELIETIAPVKSESALEIAPEIRTEQVIDNIPEVSQLSPPTDHQKVTKVSKRKLNSDYTDDSHEYKRRKSSGKKSVVDSSWKEETSHTDDREWDIKRPPRLENKERRSSTSSNSSQHSNTSQITKKTKNQSTEPDRKPDIKPIGLDVKEEVLPVLEQNGNSSRYPSSVEMPSWSRDTDGYGDEIVQDPSPGQQRKVTRRLESADTYLHRAKELKHQADNLSDKLAKSLTYTEAILSFIQCGYAMESEAISESSTIFTMYTRTYKFLADICRFRSKHEFNNNMTAKEKKLAVLRLRIQSYLCLKLFKLKKVETMRLKKAIDDINKATSKPSAPNHAPSPHQNSWNNNRSTGTPSPMSPMPSPANSIGSVGSQGSCNDLTPSKLPNGTLSAGTTMTSMSSPAPGTIMVDQRLHSLTQQFLSFSGYLVQCHDFWEQADAAMHDSREFFEDLDEQCGPLTLHSNIPDLVTYVQTGLHRLKDT